MSDFILFKMAFKSESPYGIWSLTSPQMCSNLTEPNTRLSVEWFRLSPITKYVFGETVIVDFALFSSFE